MGWNACWLVLLLLAMAGPATGSSLERFFGEYAGKTISQNEDGLSARDIGVTISKTRAGFNISWTTIVPKGAGRAKKSSYSIDFEPTRRANIYESAMRTDLFGNRRPLNPLEGDPYVWATLRNDTLTVYALIITKTGEYEMQTYNRSLEDGGLHLEFSRIRDGLHKKYITGHLERVK